MAAEATGAQQKAPTPEQLIRNWHELLQELRVMQTGVQILTGFLLTVPFSARFDTLEPHQKWLYLAVLVGAVLTTCLIVAPVAFHRMVFRQRKRAWLVATAHVSARLGLAGMAIVVSGVVLLVFDVVAGGVAAVIATAGVVLVFVVLWLVVPQLARSGRTTNSRR